MYTTVLLGREAHWTKNLRYGLQSRRKTTPLIHNFALESLFAIILLGIQSTSACSWDSTFLTVRNIRVCLCAFSCSSAECLSLLHEILCEECLPILSWTATQATLSRASSPTLNDILDWYVPLHWSFISQDVVQCWWWCPGPNCDH